MMNKNKVGTIAGLFIALYVVGVLSIVGGVVAIVFHFASKYW